MLRRPVLPWLVLALLLMQYSMEPAPRGSGVAATTASPRAGFTPATSSPTNAAPPRPRRVPRYGVAPAHSHAAPPPGAGPHRHVVWLAEPRPPLPARYVPRTMAPRRPGVSMRVRPRPVAWRARAVWRHEPSRPQSTRVAASGPPVAVAAPDGVYRGTIAGFSVTAVYIWDGPRLLSLPLRPSSHLVVDGRRARVWDLRTGQSVAVALRGGSVRALSARTAQPPATTPRARAAPDRRRHAAGPRFAGPPRLLSAPTTDTWTQTNGPPIFTYGLTFDPHTPSTLWAGTNSQLYESQDSGQTWQPRAMNGLLVTADPFTSNELYTVNAFLNCPANCGFNSSADGGVTWATVSNALTCPNDMAVDPGQQGAILVVSNNCPNGIIYRSTDSGHTFTATVTYTNSEVSSLTVDPLAPANVYAAVVGAGIVHSADYGQTWSMLAAQPADLGFSIITAFTQTAATALLAGTNSGRIFESADGGASWSEVDGGLPVGVTILDLAHDPASGSLYAANSQGGGLYLSTNGGATWTRSAGGPTGGIGVSVINHLHADVTGVWAAGDGLFRGTDHGVTWVQQDARAADSGTVSAGGDGALYSTHYPSGPWKSSDHGQTWSAANQVGPTLGNVFGAADLVAVAPSNPQHLYDQSGPTGLYTSTNGAGYWTAGANPAPPIPGAPAGLAVDPTDEHTLWATAATGLFVSHDGGASWTATGLTNTAVSSVVVANTTPRTLYVAVPVGAALSAGVWKSADGGATWSFLIGTQTSGSPVGLALGPTMALSPTLYVGTSQGELKSIDGVHWSVLNGASSGLSVGFAFDSMAIDPVYPLLVEGTGYGQVLRSIDGGATWTNINIPLGSNPPIAVDPTQGNVFYVGSGRGVWSDTTNPLLLSAQAPSALVPDGQGGYQGNPFTVTATLTDTAVAAQQGVSVTLTLPPGLSFTQGVTTTTPTSQTTSVGALGGSALASFGVWAASVISTTLEPYTLTATSTTTTTAPVTLTGAILLPGTGGSLQAFMGTVPADFFPRGAQTAVISSTVLGPAGDPTFSRTPFTVTVGVYTQSTGQLVRTLDSGSHAQSDHWQWDGTTDGGALVAPGSYEATLTAVASGGYTGTASVAVQVDADAPAPPCQLGVGGVGPESRHTSDSTQHWVDNVNTYSGDYRAVATDLAGLPSEGIPLELTRYYNSQCNTAGGALGPGWSFTYGERLGFGDDGHTALITHTLENGQQVTYTPLLNPDGSQQVDTSGDLLYQAPPGEGDTLSYSPTTSLYQVSYCTNGCFARFNTQGQLAELHDRDGHVVQVSYPPGQLIAGEQISGVTQSVTMTLNAGGRITALADPTGRTWSYSYTAGLLTGVTDPQQHTTLYSYGSNGALTQIQDPAGGTTTLGYDAATRVISVTDALSNTITYAYGYGAGSSGTGPTASTLVTDALSHQEQDYYDANGRLRQILEPSGISLQMSVDAAYHAVGSAVGAPQGTVATNASYDANGDQTSSVDGLGHASTSAFNAAGDLLAQTDANGFTAGNGYDVAGDLLTATDVLGQSSLYGVDANGNVLTSTDALGHATTARYDAFGNPLTTTDALSTSTTTAYDALGQPISTTDALSQTSQTAYDSLGRVISRTDTLGRTTQSL